MTQADAILEALIAGAAVPAIILLAAFVLKRVIRVLRGN